MISSGAGIIAGSLNLTAVPCPSEAVRYTTIVRRNTSPFKYGTSETPRVEKVQPVKKPKPRVYKARTKEEKEKSPGRKHQPYYEQDRIVQARLYMETPKICTFCHTEFSAREGERIDGYKRRETCSRVCAGKRARLRRLGELDD